MKCLQMLIHHRRLIWNLILLDFKVRYAGSTVRIAVDARWPDNDSGELLLGVRKHPANSVYA